MDSAAYDKVVIEGQYADELCRQFDMMSTETGSVFTLLGLLRGVRFPLTKGILHLDYGGKDDIEITFNLEGDSSGSGHYKHSHGLEWRVQGANIIPISKPARPQDKDELVKVARYFTNLFKAVMQRMAERKQEVVMDERRIPKVKKGKVKHGKKQKNRTVYVRQVVYKVPSPPPPSNEEDKEKREYERQTFRWTRKGHHRRLRNGEVRWFPEKEIILDPNAVKESKTYKIQRGKGEQNDG